MSAHPTTWGNQLVPSVFFSYSRWYVVFLTASNSLKEPNIGDLYDCSISTWLGVYAAPTENTCTYDIKNQRRRKFQAMVKQYEKLKTTVDLYLCEVQVWTTKECDENFVGMLWNLSYQ